MLGYCKIDKLKVVCIIFHGHWQSYLLRTRTIIAQISTKNWKPSKNFDFSELFSTKHSRVKMSFKVHAHVASKHYCIQQRIVLYMFSQIHYVRKLKILIIFVADFAAWFYFAVSNYLKFLQHSAHRLRFI